MSINTIELFAGSGGLALGLERAGFHHIMLNEYDKNCAQTLKLNKPNWNVIHEDIKKISFKPYKNIQMVTGGFPCQAFSHSGKRLGFEDARGTLFYEFARAVDECRPDFFLIENVKGLITHDKGRTIQTIINTLEDLKYHVFNPLLLNSKNYHVAQNRERVFIFGCLKKFKNKVNFEAPPKVKSITLHDILKSTSIFKENIEKIQTNSPKYSKEKENLFALIPQGGNWKNLNLDLQKQYMGQMFYSGGGKTGVLKKLSYSDISPTILTSPSQKQTERCHPEFNRPLSIRECARIQSYPDNWKFTGSISAQYKQIGNSVPPELAFHLGKYLYDQIKDLY